MAHKKKKISNPKGSGIEGSDYGSPRATVGGIPGRSNDADTPHAPGRKNADPISPACPHDNAAKGDDEVIDRLPPNARVPGLDELL